MNIVIDGKRSQFELGNLVVEMGTNKVVQSKQVFACMAANSDGNQYICPEVTISEPVPFNKPTISTYDIDVDHEPFSTGNITYSPVESMNIVPPPPTVETYKVEGKSVVVEEYESSEEEVMPVERDIIYHDDIPEDFLLEDVLDALNISPDLLPEQRQAESDLVKKYPKVFAGPFGCNLPPVEIKLRDPTPHKEQRRPMSLASQKLIDECVQELLKAGVIGGGT